MNDYRYIPGDEAILAPLSDEERKAIAVHVMKAWAGRKGGRSGKYKRKHTDKWTPDNAERDKRIRALAFKGVSYKQIAHEFNLCADHVYNIAPRRRLGLPVRAPTLAFHSSAGRTSYPQYTGKPLNNDGVA